jgi:hypothetical protein
MHRVNLDTADSAVKKFLGSLPLDPDGVELELAGKVVYKVTGPAQLTDAEKQRLLDKVRANIRQAHERNKDVPARVIARKVDKAVKTVREQGRSPARNRDRH